MAQVAVSHPEVRRLDEDRKAMIHREHDHSGWEVGSKTYMRVQGLQLDPTAKAWNLERKETTSVRPKAEIGGSETVLNLNGWRNLQDTQLHQPLRVLGSLAGLVVDGRC